MSNPFQKTLPFTYILCYTVVHYLQKLTNVNFRFQNLYLRAISTQGCTFSRITLRKFLWYSRTFEDLKIWRKNAWCLFLRVKSCPFEPLNSKLLINLESTSWLSFWKSFACFCSQISSNFVSKFEMKQTEKYWISCSSKWYTLTIL